MATGSRSASASTRTPSGKSIYNERFGFDDPGDFVSTSKTTRYRIKKKRMEVLDEERSVAVANEAQQEYECPHDPELGWRPVTLVLLECQVQHLMSMPMENTMTWIWIWGMVKVANGIYFG